MTVNFSALPDLTKLRLENLSRRIQDQLPSSTQTFRIESTLLLPNSPPTSFLLDLDGWVKKKRAYLYYLQALYSPNLLPIEKAFSKAKSKSNRAFARLNTHSEFLYVGSSSDIGKRIREHLGYGANATYALQLAHWCKNVNLTLEFVLAEYPLATEPDVLQTLEDTLWDNLKPMFGRKGAK